LEPATREAWLTGAELPDPVALAELDDGDELLQAATIRVAAPAAATAEPTRNSDVFFVIATLQRCRFVPTVVVRYSKLQVANR
jgi:hypothetical protein